MPVGSAQATASGTPESAPVQYPRPWLVILTVNFGSIAALAASTGLINMIMPRMMGELGADVRSLQWVQTSLLLTQAVLMPAVGWAGSAIGQKRLYVASLSLFAVGAGGPIAPRPGCGSTPRPRRPRSRAAGVQHHNRAALCRGLGRLLQRLLPVHGRLLPRCPGAHPLPAARPTRSTLTIPGPSSIFLPK